MKSDKQEIIHPIANRIVVRRQKPATVSKGGIHIPDVGKQKTCRGEVLAVGPGRSTDEGVVVPMSSRIKKGAIVVFGKYAGNEIDDDDEDLLIMTELDIIGVVE